MAERYLCKYGLEESGWSFGWDRAIRRYGCCNFTDKRISLSKKLAALNPVDESIETILHEVAHALAGPGAGHGPRWKDICQQIGARPIRCYDGRQIKQPESPYVRYCPHCYKSHSLYRRTRRKAACALCCNQYNRGRYAERFRLRLVTRKEYEQLLRTTASNKAEAV